MNVPFSEITVSSCVFYDKLLKYLIGKLFFANIVARFNSLNLTTEDSCWRLNTNYCKVETDYKIPKQMKDDNLPTRSILF